jgi:plasmid maintenance system antidote protein VapI
MKKLTQIKIAEILGVTPPYISELLSGKHPISWKIADKLSILFPGKSIKEWKSASPEDVKRAFKYFSDNRG